MFCVHQLRTILSFVQDAVQELRILPTSAICVVTNYCMEAKEKMKIRWQNKIRKGSLADCGFGYEEMKKSKVCPACHTLQSSGNVKCISCRAELSKGTLFDFYKSQHNNCSHCGTVVSEKMLFCPGCGQSIKLKTPAFGR